jgi:CTP:molybdopterin cytidylyltransferase MocA
MIVGIVLAAGASSRMGRPKAFLPLGEDTFLSRVCRTLAEAGVDDLVVIAGSEAAEAERELERVGVLARVVENARRDQGQLTSVQAGLAVADRPGVDAVLVHLVDVPLVAPGTVVAVVEAFRRTHAPIVRPSVEGRHGHPVLFGRSIFDELRAADPAVGAKAVVRAHAADAVDVAVNDAGACQDIDTPEDYESLIGPLPDERDGGSQILEAPAKAGTHV